MARVVEMAGVVVWAADTVVDWDLAVEGGMLVAGVAAAAVEQAILAETTANLATAAVALVGR